MVKFSELTGETLTYTENGALALATTGSPLIDFLFLAGNIHSDSKVLCDKIIKIKEAYNDDVFKSLLLLMRDVKNGMGVRQNTRDVLLSLIDKGIDVYDIILLLPEIGRWDDVVYIFHKTNDREVRKLTFKMIYSQLLEDIKGVNDNKPISLLAKWMPSINASSKETRKQAIDFITYSLLDKRTYRKMLSKLRAYLDVVERKTCDNKWHEIDYEKLPSLAMQKYYNAFLRNDTNRFNEYLKDVKNGKKKMNTGVMPIHMLVRNRHKLGKELFNKIWNEIDVSYIDSDMLPVVDVSYSMESVKIFGGTLRDMAIGIGAMASYKQKGEFKDKVIVYSDKAMYIDLSEYETPYDRVEMLCEETEISNTNLTGVFEHILMIAKHFGVSDDDMPKRILLISDMQFDTPNECNAWIDTTTPINIVKEMYKESGYTFPNMIYWNMHGELIVPQAMDDNIVYLSGFQPKLLEFLECKSVDCVVDRIVGKYNRMLKK